MTDAIRFEVRVTPRARTASVGGSWGPNEALRVAVTAPAADGRANAAVLKLLASVLQVKPRQLSIVAGARHRTKLIELADPPPGTGRRLARRRAGPAESR